MITYLIIRIAMGIWNMIKGAFKLLFRASCYLTVGSCCLTCLIIWVMLVGIRDTIKGAIRLRQESL